MSYKEKAIKSVFWTGMQQFGSQFISFFVSIILARLLSPADFGTISLFGIFTGISVLIMSSGMTTSLIRSKNVDERDLSTVFIFNIIVAFIMYIIIFTLSPYIEEFYKIENLSNVIRVYSIIFIIQAFGAVQKSLISKELNFKKLFIIQLPSLVVSSIVGIVMAYNGFGVWALVYMGIIQYLLDTIQIWLKSDFRPSLIFDKERFRKHFGFGINLTITSILNVLFQNVYTIYIGKYFSPVTLGYYNRAESLKNLPVSNIMNILKRVLVPFFSTVSNDVDLKRYYKKILTIVLFILSPILVLMTFQAENIVVILLTDKWIQVIPYLQILCISGLLVPLSEYNLNVLTVKGRSDLILKLEIYKKTITILVFGISIYWGIYGILIGQVFNSLFIYIINSYYTKKMIDYSLYEQFKDIIPYFTIALISSLISYYITQSEFLIVENRIINLAVFTVINGIIYIVLSKMLNLDAFTTLKNIIIKEK